MVFPVGFGGACVVCDVFVVIFVVRFNGVLVVGTIFNVIFVVGLDGVRVVGTILIVIFVVGLDGANVVFKFCVVIFVVGFVLCLNISSKLALGTLKCLPNAVTISGVPFVGGGLVINLSTTLTV